MTEGITVSLLATSWRAGQQGPVWLPYPSFPEQIQESAARLAISTQQGAMYPPRTRVGLMAAPGI